MNRTGLFALLFTNLFSPQVVDITTVQSIVNKVNNILYKIYLYLYIVVIYDIYTIFIYLFIPKNF